MRYSQLSSSATALVLTLGMTSLLSACVRPEPTQVPETSASVAAICELWRSSLWEAQDRDGQIAELDARESLISSPCGQFLGDAP